MDIIWYIISIANLHFDDQIVAALVHAHSLRQLSTSFPGFCPALHNNSGYLRQERKSIIKASIRNIVFPWSVYCRKVARKEKARDENFTTTIIVQ